MRFRPAFWAGLAMLFGHAAASAAVFPSITFSAATSDNLLNYPTPMLTLMDEHTTLQPYPTYYLLFGASNFKTGNKFNTTGAYILESPDLINFTLIPGVGASVAPYSVMWSSTDFSTCDFTGAPVFDQNYAAPGSVLQDPTLPAGNMVMLYEAEKHCPAGGGGFNEFNYWASVGFARSPDGGKTWPQPGSYGTTRYAALQVPGSEPATAHQSWGDALPSGFVDDVNVSSGTYLYASYYFNGDTSTVSDSLPHVARAQLGGGDPLQFFKWYADTNTHTAGFTQPGIGGLETSPLRSKGCANPAYAIDGEISYVDPLGVYLMTFICVNMQNLPLGSTTYVPLRATWYYSMASSLAVEDWTAPQPIANSDAPTVNGLDWDGWYGSFMSPGYPPGHLGLSGTVFSLKGSPIAARIMSSRSWSIGVSTPLAGGGGNLTINPPHGPVTLSVPPGALPSSVNVTLQPPLPPFPAPATNAAPLTGTGVGVEIDLSPAAQPNGNVTLTIGYKPADFSGPENQLLIARFDSTTNVWVPLVSMVDTLHHTVTAQTNHFSLFQVMQAAPAGFIETVQVFPNPFRPAQGHTSVTFANVPAGARVRLYTLAGERVRSLTANASGLASWDGRNDAGQPAASGVYYALIESGGDKKVVEVAVQR